MIDEFKKQNTIIKYTNYILKIKNKKIRSNYV